MAKTTAAQKPAPDTAPHPEKDTAETVNVTYRPFDGDPVRTRCWGLRFEANIPTAVPKSLSVTIDVPTVINMPDGSTRTVTNATKVPVLELARNNPSFEVEGHPRAKRVIDKKRKVPPPGQDWAAQHEDEIDTEVAA